MDAKPFVEAYNKVKDDVDVLKTLGDEFSGREVEKYANQLSRIEREKDWQERSKMLYELATQVKQDLGWSLGRKKLGDTIGDKLTRDERYGLFVNVGVKALEDAIEGKQ